MIQKCRGEFVCLRVKKPSLVVLLHFMEVSTIKQPYEAPIVEVVEVKPEGIIAASGEVPDMPRGWEWNF